MPVTRGTTNRNARGSSYSRRRRKQKLLDKFGDGKKAPCYRCKIMLDFTTITVDKIIPAVAGGTYVFENCRPACGPCNSSTGGSLSGLAKVLQELEQEMEGEEHGEQERQPPVAAPEQPDPVAAGDPQGRPRRAPTSSPGTVTRRSATASS